jgi:hypothetical protein
MFVSAAARQQRALNWTVEVGDLQLPAGAEVTDCSRPV